MIDKKVIGIMTLGSLILYLFLSMGQTPDTSQAIYFVNYTSGNNTTYMNIDYILVNVSVNDTTIQNHVGIRIDLYNASGDLVATKILGDFE